MWSVYIYYNSQTMQHTYTVCEAFFIQEYMPMMGNVCIAVFVTLLIADKFIFGTDILT